MATQFLQKVYYRTFHRGSIPAEGDKKFRKHFNVIYVGVVIAYLAYTFVQVERDLPPSLYTYLDLSPSFTPQELRTQWKAMSLTYHPDKVQYATAEEKAWSEAIYIRLRQAYETLKDPTMKSVYDRFGDVVFQCTSCKTERDFLMAYLPGSISFYLGTGVMLVLFSVLGRIDFGSYWRFVGLISLAALEACVAIRASPLPWIFFPWRTPSQKIAILHQLFVVISIAFSQLGPILFPVDRRPLKQRLLELDGISGMLAKESVAMFRAAFEPFAHDPAAAGELQRKMEKLVQDLKVHEADPALGVAASQAQARLRRKP
ncbi:hypothetical protein BDK51DRAFT_32511 [Blyttiomyces helicus]|uniref:J domain-containing protein n=1 Tax=Blyttiomyces helicus TaxID=388810 RepID=A0A4P9W7C8_9FUNG|nr:hypothetical protein BDK51DRAFT_32511 [Blyttiomyces helicus]|eukprot:RKO88361.1 hypothetical protein BDK51DRAFT_32511 [Blyttiomyces helicus]